jgi:hypothetical protein
VSDKAERGNNKAKIKVKKNQEDGCRDTKGGNKKVKVM